MQPKAGSLDSADQDDLWSKVVRGGAWLLALRVVQRALTFGRIILLARLLSPHDFGLMGIALVALGMIRQFTDAGLRLALIQKRGNVDAYVGTAWTGEALRGLLQAVVVFGAASLLARFFDAPEAKLILQVVAVALVLDGTKNAGLAHLQRDLAFKRYSAYNFAIIATDVVVSVVAAIVLRSVWALAIGYLASNAVAFGLSYFVAPRCRWFELDMAKFRELFRFGRWIMASQFIEYFLLQADRIVVAKVLGVASLGLYQMAYQIADVSPEEVKQIASRVTFPAYARMQEQIDRVREVYLKQVQIVGLVSLPIATGTILLAESFTRLVLGDQWLPMVGIMQLLAIWAVMRALAQTTIPLLHGLGRPDLPTKGQAVQFVILAVVIYPFTLWWGAEGAVLALIAAGAVAQPVVWLLAIRLIGTRVRDVVGALSPALAGALAAGVSVRLLRQAGLEPESIGVFLALVAITVAMYFLALALWAAFFRWNPKRLLV